MDVLDDILSTLDLQGTLYFRTDLSGSWGVTVPDFEYAARFHLVVQGECHVQIEDGPHHILNAGDIILIPRGRSHILSHEKVDSAPSLETVLSTSGYDGRGLLVSHEGNATAATQMICGHFNFRRGADHSLLKALPVSLVISNADRARFTWLDELLRLLARNVFSTELGSRSTVIRLSEIVFLELLRSHFNDQKDLLGIYAAFSDKMIGRSLELIHNRTEEVWTIAKLASTIGMSRSRFAERFKELVGVGPMGYLTEWRLQKSLAMLDDGKANIGPISTEVGYQSAAAFTRAFSARFGVSPTAYRNGSNTVAA